MSRLPIVMYHNFTNQDDCSVGLTLSASKFEAQLRYLSSQGYTFYFASEILKLKSIASKAVVLTFDDVTVNQLEIAVPLLEKYHCKATFFVPFAYLGKSDEWNEYDGKKGNPIMTAAQLRSLNASYIELAHHSFLHKPYTTLTADEIRSDFEASYRIIQEEQLTVSPILAYPYGNYPKKGRAKTIFFKILVENGIVAAFRIGNRVNKFPLQHQYEIQRIDVKGQDSLWRFKWKLRWGKLKLF